MSGGTQGGGHAIAAVDTEGLVLFFVLNTPSVDDHDRMCMPIFRPLERNGPTVAIVFPSNSILVILLIVERLKMSVDF